MSVWLSWLNQNANVVILKEGWVIQTVPPFLREPLLPFYCLQVTNQLHWPNAGGITYLPPVISGRRTIQKVHVLVFLGFQLWFFLFFRRIAAVDLSSRFRRNSMRCFPSSSFVLN